MNQCLVRVNCLLQIGCMRNIVRKGGIGIKIGKQFVRFFLRERFFRSDDGGTENTSCKIAPTGDELDIAGKSGLQLPQRLFDFGYMAMPERLIDADVAVSPAEMRRIGRFDACARRAGDGIHCHITRKQIKNEKGTHIKKYNMEPIVTQIGNGYSSYTTYKLSDYTDELAEQNYISVATGSKATVAKFQSLFKQIANSNGNRSSGKNVNASGGKSR